MQKKTRRLRAAIGLKLRADPARGSWMATGRLTTKRSQHTATLLPNGKVLVTGSSNGGRYLIEAELYYPASGTWSATDNLATKRYKHMATLLPNGKVSKSSLPR